jgi:hypothetical protein
MKFGIVIAVLAVSSVFFILACSDSDNPVAPPQPSGTDSAAILSMAVDTATVGSLKQVNITIRVNGPLYQGNYYAGYKPMTDFAVWIENATGSYVNTVKVSKGSAAVGGYSAHEAHLPLWQASSGLDLNKVSNLPLDTSGTPIVLDGLTAASLKCRSNADTTLTLTWNIKNSSGVAAPAGIYTLCVETANISKNKIINGTDTTAGPITVNNNYRKKSFVF